MLPERLKFQGDRALFKIQTVMASASQDCLLFGNQFYNLPGSQCVPGLSSHRAGPPSCVRVKPAILTCLGASVSGSSSQ